MPKTPPEKRKTLAEIMAETQADGDDGGLICPSCECRHFYTTSIWRPKDGTVRRHRRCRHCGHRIKTLERVAK